MYVVSRNVIGTEYLTEASSSYPFKYRWDRKAKKASAHFSRSQAYKLASKHGGKAIKV